MKKILLLLLCLPTIVFAKSTIYDTRAERFISVEEFVSQMPEKGQIVLGEYHYQESIQKAEGEIIEMVVKGLGVGNNFSTTWEFLDYPNQSQVETDFTKFVQGQLSVEEFLMALFPNSRSPQQNLPYRHMFEVTKKFGGQVVATNAPREWKSVITRDGLGALDPKFIPPNMEMGGDLYFERFEEAMGGHVPQEALIRYFEAQCYTDSVMANSISTLADRDLRFLIVGSFHSDYNDGVVRQIGNLFSAPTVTVKIIDRESLKREELRDVLTPHPDYGIIADFIFIANDR